MSESLIRLVRLCGIHRNLGEGKRAHAQIVDARVAVDRYLANLLVQMYGRCGSPDEAKRVFDSIQEPNHFSWQLLMLAFAQNGHLLAAKRTFDQMPQRTVASWTSLLSASAQQDQSTISTFRPLTTPCDVFDKMPARTYVAWNILLLHSKDMECAVKTLEAMPERTLESWNSFIVAACSRCSLSQAKHAFDKMPQQNTLSWNPLLHAYAVHGELQFAKQIFNQLPQRTLLTWTALLAGYVHQADVFLPEALELFQKMPQFDERSSTSVMKAFAEHGRVDEASKVFYGIPAASRDTVSWSTMLSGLAQAGQGWKALEMFHLMMLDGVSADGHCFTSLLLAWRHLGLVNQSIQLLLTMMDDHGVELELDPILLYIHFSSFFFQVDAPYGLGMYAAERVREEGRAMAAASTLAPGLARKLKKVLDTRTDSPEVLASLATLSTFYGENTAPARRNLQATIERRALSINEEFLRSSEGAQKALDVVEMEVAALALSCDSIAGSLSSCSEVTTGILLTTEKLRADLDSVNQRQRVVSSFLHNYQLSPEEVAALRDDEVNQTFFQALSRVQEIHANCKMLLRTHHQRAGLELMDMMAVYQEAAYERLCRWVQTECRSLSDSDHPEVSDLLRTASGCLRERPVLFKYCAEEVANTRHNALFRRFISALTRGGPGGMPRPIEVHAHDPLRYVGDMLAWLHQALASEKELVSSLFCAETSGKGDESQSVLASVLDRVFEGVCRPFKVRVEQVLQSQPGLQVAYKLCNLLGFYSDMIGDLLGSEAALSVTLNDVKQAAERTFFDILKVRGDKLLRYPPPVPADLSPPPAVFEGVSVLVELIESYDSMMVAAGRTKPRFEPVTQALVDPILQMCERATETVGLKSPGPAHARRASSVSSESGRRLSNAARRTESVDDIVLLHSASQDVESVKRMFLVNCLSAVRQPLVSQAAAAEYVKSVAAAIEEHMAALVEQEAVGILGKCGLQKQLSCLGTKLVALSEVEEMSPSNVADSLKLFLKFVSEGVVAEFSQLQDTRLRSEAGSRVAGRLASAYEAMYEAISDPSNGYPEPRLLLRHTPEQMRTMLGI